MYTYNSAGQRRLSRPLTRNDLYPHRTQCQVNGFEGASLGPRMSEENRRNFSEEHNRKGRDANVSLQYGSNKGASQAGLNMGKQRMITDDKE